MAKYSNEQIDAIIEEAYAQYTGNKEPGEIDLTQFTDEGTNADYVVARDRFTNALLTASTKRMYTDRAFGDSFKDEFYVDAREFGGAMTIVSIEAPEVRENPAWHDFVSGTSQVGQYTVYIPVVEEKVYAKSTSWALPFTVTDEQWDTAFASKEDLRDFVAQIFIAVENKIKEHIKNEAALNRANFIAEKMQYAATPEAKGVHAVNLVKAYLDEKGIAGGMTVTEFDQNFEAKKWAIARMALDYDYIQDQSGLYNVGNKVKFIPKDRIRFQMLAHFAKKLEFDVLAPSFNKSILSIQFIFFTSLFIFFCPPTHHFYYLLYLFLNSYSSFISSTSTSMPIVVLLYKLTHTEHHSSISSTISYSCSSHSLNTSLTACSFSSCLSNSSSDNPIAVSSSKISAS